MALLAELTQQGLERRGRRSPTVSDIISLRYGLTSTKPCTLEAVGGLLNLSRERVRQIQSKAMRKLRRPQMAERLKSWLG